MMALTLSLPVADWLTPCEKTVTVFAGADPSRFGDAREVPSSDGSKRFTKAARVGVDEAGVECVPLHEGVEQPSEEGDIAVGVNWQVHVGKVGRHRSARVDEHHTHARPLRLGLGEPLVDHWVAPGEIGADQHHEIGLFDVLVVARHSVRTEGAFVAGHGRGHAEA